MAAIYFHDLPVYRVSAEKFTAEIRRLVEREVAQAAKGAFPIQSEHLATLRKNLEGHLYEKFGPWRFNEVIGYLRLHFLGSQVRGEYFCHQRKRYNLSRTKALTYQTHKLAPELDIPHPATNQMVLDIILNYVDSCRRELPRRHLDDQWLRTVGPFVDWNHLRHPGRN